MSLKLSKTDNFGKNPYAMKRIKIHLLVLLFGLLSNSHVYATKSCDCESHAIELTNKTNYNEVLKALITDHQETYKMQFNIFCYIRAFNRKLFKCGK